MLVDSHCHLNYLDDPDAAIHAAALCGVEKILCIGVEQERIAEVLSFAARFDNVWATVGQHPESTAAEPLWVAPLLTAPKVVAVGEMGLDYFHAKLTDDRTRQQQNFDYQLGIAGEHDLPVVVHTRDAEAATLALLRKHPGVRGVLHCFTESWDMAETALALGYYISISGIVTFKNGANVRDVAKRVPDERLLVETDAPWLAPVPHRGTQNQPAFITDTAKFVAELRNVSLTHLAAITSRNFTTLFGI